MVLVLCTYLTICLYFLFHSLCFWIFAKKRVHLKVSRKRFKKLTAKQTHVVAVVQQSADNCFVSHV